MISFHGAALRQTKFHQYCVRFFIGGLCTVAAGIIGKRYGPAIGGLFLAFPAIFPAGASLIESHEKQNKAKIGANGVRRGRLAASIDATGAALGSIALLCFAVTTWKLMSEMNATAAISLGILAWTIVASSLWLLRRHRIFRSF